MPDIGLILLAAGASTRMGTPKQLLQYQGKTLISHMLRQAIASVCNPIIVVLGAYADRIRPEVEMLNTPIIENQNWSIGMSTSIRCGIEALNEINPNVEGVVLMLCDQPLVSTQIINQLLAMYKTTARQIIASEYAGIHGVPAFFHRNFFTPLTKLNGATGARQVIQQYATQVFSVPFPEGTLDLDTPQDYEHFLNG